jgi:CHAD domain-containing protein
MAEAVLEEEAKYELDGPVDPVLDRLARAVPGSSFRGPVRHDLEARYYDTDDLRLVRSGATLRRREGGKDAGWHLKLATGDGVRTEWREPLGADVPGSLLSLSAGLRRGRPPVPVVDLRTVRREWELVDARGRVLLELADDQVEARPLSSGAEGGCRAWHEVEVERRGAEVDVMAAVGRALRQAGGRPAAAPSKLARALGPAAGRPVAGELPDLSGKVRAADVLTARFRAQAAEVLRHDPGVRQGGVDAVHDMRVALRRLRALLRTFRPCFDRDRARALSAELRWWGGLLSPVRDADVLDEQLTARLAALPREDLVGDAAAGLHLELADARSRDLARALAAMEAERYLALLEAVVDWSTRPRLAPPAFRPAAKVLPRLVHKEHRRLRRRVAEVPPPGAPGRDEAMHEVRKAAKRVRYAGETLRPLYGPRAERYVARAKMLHTLLGDRQDAVVARELLRQLGRRLGSTPGHNGYTYGVLAGGEAARIAQADEDFGPAWAEAGRRSMARWPPG